VADALLGGIVATRFQQLGAFVQNVENLTDDQLVRFSVAGGKWIVVLLAQLGYPDDHDPSCVSNLAHIEALKARCVQFGISVGGWFNGWAGGILNHTAYQDAQQVADIVHQHNLGPVCLDLEAAYQWPGGIVSALPPLLAGVRLRLPARSIFVSSNSPNDSFLWNGGPRYAGCMYRLGIRLAPQWYNSPPYGQRSNPWTTPDLTMEWLQAHGMEDNFRDPMAPGQRAVPLSFVHGTLEVTGLEGADLAGELHDLREAQAHYGYTKGFSIYTLESTPVDDFKLLAAERGHLFSV
jgi:hypothetical protein